MSEKDPTPRAAARRYYKVSPAFWRTRRDDDTRLCALYLLTSPHRTTEGLFYMPRAYAQADLGWPAKRFNRAFDRLIAEDFIDYDDESGVCLIVNALAWQSPQNANQAQHAVKALEQLPPNRLANRFRTLVETHSERLWELLPNGCPKGSPTLIAHSSTSRKEGGAMSESDSAVRHRLIEGGRA